MDFSQLGIMSKKFSVKSGGPGQFDYIQTKLYKNNLKVNEHIDVILINVLFIGQLTLYTAV